MNKIAPEIVVDIILSELCRSASDLGNSLPDAQAAADIHRIAEVSQKALLDIQQKAEEVIRKYLNQSGLDEIELDKSKAGYETTQTSQPDQDIWQAVCKENVVCRDAQTQFEKATKNLKAAKYRLRKSQRENLALFFSERKFHITHK